MKRRTGSTSVSPTLCIHSVNVAKIESNSLSIPISINKSESEIVETQGLLDSGAGGNFIDQIYVRNNKLKTKELARPLQARNVDGTKNKQGTITSCVDLELEIAGKRWKYD